ncbi:inositol 1,4,5-triphosphate receptor associated 2 isoform X7 [Gallus gallus]|uniref:inositol 1,4,5-triphosphate receptor associated 2 isoform X7 n=1 Tax=Gallus gallus TaxID=9031 RepID=UPI001F00CCA2|nr:inositol 1,4,5-triphosphate receptor associated 2 isoform X7 [Gallus gallus]
MKPRVDTSLGVGKEVWGRAQGRAAWRQRRGCRQSPPQSREQQAEPARLLAAPDEGRMSSPQEHLDRVLAGSKESMGSISEHEEGVWSESAPSQEPGTELAFCTGDGDGIEEDEETPEELLLSFPSELSVLERLGLHSTNLTEQDVEAAFAHLALAFRCDMFTLQQRAQVEKRAQDAAEENIQEELGQCQTFLERLSTSCMDVSCKEVLEQLQCSLAVLAAAIKRATSAAEKLGAVHQEARMSRAAEVMVQHVDNLKRHHLREHAELEEMKCLIQQNSRNRQLAETQDDAEQQLRPHPLMRGFQQASARRRVSIAVIPKQLVPASGVDGRETLAGRPKGAQRQTSTQSVPFLPPQEQTGATKPGQRGLCNPNAASMWVRSWGAGGWRFVTVPLNLPCLSFPMHCPRSLLWSCGNRGSSSHSPTGLCSVCFS